MLDSLLHVVSVGRDVVLSVLIRCEFEANIISITKETEVPTSIFNLESPSPISAKTINCGCLEVTVGTNASSFPVFLIQIVQFEVESTAESNIIKVWIKPTHVFKDIWVDNFVGITSQNDIIILSPCLHETICTALTVEYSTLETNRKINVSSATLISCTVISVELSLHKVVTEVIWNLFSNIVDDFIIELTKSIFVLLVIQWFFIATDSKRRLS